MLLSGFFLSFFSLFLSMVVATSHINKTALVVEDHQQKLATENRYGVASLCRWKLEQLLGSLEQLTLSTLFCSTIVDKNNDTNDKFYPKVEFLMYTEMFNFRPQSWKAASKLKPHRGLGTRLPSSW